MKSRLVAGSSADFVSKIDDYPALADRPASSGFLRSVGSAHARPSARPDPLTGVVSLIGDIPGSRFSAARVFPGVAISSRLNYNGDHDWFGIRLVAGNAYRFDLAASGLDVLLGLRNSAGVLLRSDDDSGVGLNSRIIYRAPVTGTYFLDAGAYRNIGVGAYSLRATTIDADVAASTRTAAGIAINSVRRGSLGVRGDHDWYRVYLAAGRTYRFALNSTSFDPLLTLRGGGGAALRSDDDSGIGLNSLISYRAPVSGYYYLDAGAYRNAGVGAYALQAVLA